MANLVLTTVCNRQCVYCFADKHKQMKQMSVEDAMTCMELTLASGRREIRLLGGEPTLHPLFADILQAAQDHGLEVLIFSNGLMPDSALQSILEVPREKCRVLLNLNVGERYPCESRFHLSRVATELGERAFVGVNIYAPGLPLMEAADFAKEHCCKRNIRLGLAHPRLDGNNRWLSPRDYQRAGQEIEEFASAIYGDGFSLSLDCGFVPCMFSDSFFEITGINALELGSRCGPIPDVLPDMTALHCFPLADMDQIPISGFSSLNELHVFLRERMEPLRKIGVFPECITCPLYQKGQCLGGCLSAAMLRAHQTVSQVREPVSLVEVSAEEGLLTRRQTWTIPYIDQSVGFWELVVQEHGPVIEEVYFPIGLEGVGSGRPRQTDDFLLQLMCSNVIPLAVLVNPVVLRLPLEEVGDCIVDELARLFEEYGIKKATIADVRLAERVRKRLPAMQLTASCLLEVSEPEQARSIRDMFDILVPATRMVRHPERLAALRSAFGKPLRLLVNEGCLNTCLDRKQHFYEMGSTHDNPRSLCAERLERAPWLRLTGAWVLPQHLDLYDNQADQFKLAGRVTLRDPKQYLKVLSAYVARRALWPHEIGGGPAAPLTRIAISRMQYQSMLNCDHVCEDCSVCRRLTQKGRAEFSV